MTINSLTLFSAYIITENQYLSKLVHSFPIHRNCFKKFNQTQSSLHIVSSNDTTTSTRPNTRSVKQEKTQLQVKQYDETQKQTITI